MTGWRPALRIARRNAWQNKIRTLLVLVLVALPAFAGTLIAVAYQTGQVSAEDSWKSQYGAAELAVSTRVSGENGVVPYTSGQAQRDLDQVNGLLPPGSTMTVDLGQANLAVSNGDRIVDGLSARAIEMSDPINSGLLELSGGRWPTGKDEIALSRADLEQLNADVGQRVTVTAEWLDVEFRPMAETTATATVVGVIDAPMTFRPMQLYLQAPDGPMGSIPESSNYSGIQARVTLPAGESPSAVESRLSDAGMLTHTLTSWETRGGIGFSSWPISRVQVTGIALGGLLSAGMIVGLAVIVLLAGAAFATGARRTQRDLALVAVNGGSPKHLRFILLGEALVVGVCGAILGFSLALATFIAVRTPLADLIGARLDRSIVVSLPIVGICLTSVAASIAAAWYATRRVPKMSSAAALSGEYRAGARRAYLPKLATWTFVIGLLGVVATVSETERLRALAAFDFSGPWLSGVMADEGYQFAAFFALMMLGLIALVPQLLALLGQHCRSLPVLPRLALRDAARSRHRVVPALAAVLAVTTLAVGSLVVATVIDSQREKEFLAPTPTQLVTASLYDFVRPEKPEQAQTALAHLRRTIGPVEEFLVRGTDVEVINECDPDPSYGQCATSPVSVAEPGLIMALAAPGTSEPTVRRHLDDGGIVIFDTSKSSARERPFDGFGSYPHRITAGHVRAFENDLDPRTAPTARLPVLLLEPREDTEMNTMIFGSDRAVAAVPMPSKEPLASASGLTAVYRISYPISNPQIEEMNTTLKPYQLRIVAHQTFEPRVDGIAMAIALLAALVAVLATSAVAVLAIVEQRSDMATLQAMGASPLRQRHLASIQAVMVATMGVGLGVVLGLLLGVSSTGGSWFAFVIPWRQVVMFAVGIPVLAGALTWALTARGTRQDRQIPGN